MVFHTIMETNDSKPTFKCRCCRKRKKKNPRIKDQHYCGTKSCQQSRKNRWEKKKLQVDAQYRENRKAQKSNWRNCHKTNGYQTKYRQTHPLYTGRNKKSQLVRNAERKEIVKTDVLISEMLKERGLYKKYVYKKEQLEKIVKTDTLIAVIKIYQCTGTIPMQKTG